MKLGVFGGTFDPVHDGHIRIAELALKALALDRVIVMPVGAPVHRQHAPHASAEDRFQMCRIAVEGRPGFEVSRLETDAHTACFTVDTLAHLRRELPEAELRLIIGADEAVIFPTWREPRTILKQARLAVATRPGLDATELRSRVPSWVRKNMDVLPPLNIDISATEIRARLARGLPVDQMLPEGVLAYIEKVRLYRP